MITRIGVAPRRPGLDVHDFQAHWSGTHGAVVAHLVGVARYWQNHAVLDQGEALLPWPGFDACSDIDFPDLATMQTAFASPQYQDAVRRDEAFLVDKSRGGLMLSRRVSVHGQAGPRGIRLWRFLRAAPGVRADDLHRALADAPHLPGALAQERFEALDFEETGTPAIFDAAETFWFETAPAALSALRTAAMRERAAGFSGLVRGSEYLLARVHVVPVGKDRDGSANGKTGGNG
jgi:uncharacterized protein (TIGR02118 family)